MGIKVITPPAAQITTADAKLHLRVDVSDDDALIAALVTAASAFAEHYTGRSIGSQTLELALDEFPDGAIELPQGPVTSITSIIYVDAAGVAQTLSNTLYTLDDYGIQGWAVPAVDTEWPDTLDAANAVKVRFVAGTLPAAVRAALLLIVGHLYQNRQAVIVSTMTAQEIPMGARSLLDTVKIWSK